MSQTAGSTDQEAQNINTDIAACAVCAANVCAAHAANLSNILMCVLLHLLICTALRAHIIVVEVLYKINY